MLAQEYLEHYRISDYQHWKGEWELIHGMPYAMAPSPLVLHQQINGNIFVELRKLLSNCPDCQALFEIDWEVSDDTVVKPDIIVICYKPEKKISKKPEIIFEIASPTTIKKDESIKFDLYQNAGVKYYVIIYPERKIAKVYQLNEGRYLTVGEYFDETYRFSIVRCIVALDFGLIWRVK